MWPLLICSIVAVTTIILRSFALREKNVIHASMGMQGMMLPSPGTFTDLDPGFCLAFDDANQIVVDSTSNAYIVGITSSSDFPTTAGAFQRTLASGASNAYVTKLNATGTTLTFSTYVGGSGTDNALNVALDGSNNVYIVDSENFRVLQFLAP
jgi:hypothetical protein